MIKVKKSKILCKNILILIKINRKVLIFKIYNNDFQENFIYKIII